MILKQRVEYGMEDYIAVLIQVATSDAQTLDAGSNAFYKTCDVVISDRFYICERLRLSRATPISLAIDDFSSFSVN